MSAPLTLGQAWRAIRDRLAAAGNETAALDARLLAEKAFGLTRLDLSLRENHVAGPEQVVALEALAARRLSGEPVARILGEKEFYGLAFVLNEATLVPRPETELLVDRALAMLEGRDGGRLLDLGTGTGCIPIAVLANAPGVTAVATDLSARALVAARENAGRHGVAGRIEFLQGSWFEPLPQEGRGWGGGKPRQSTEPESFDLIVSNPPYIESYVIESLSPEVRDHDPRLALDGGPDGLAPYRVIAHGAKRRLKPGGMLMVEIGSGQGRQVAELLAEAGFVDIGVDKDLAGLDRAVSGHHVHS